MKNAVRSEVSDQRDYYARTAEHYDAMHVNPTDEHGKALCVFMELAELSGPVESVLDVGAGTGRAIQKLKKRWKDTKITGIEPVEALRQIGHKNGISENELVAGDALNFAFEDNSFDYVIETGALHHIATPLVAVEEMVRVARKGVMISDSNNVGQGNSYSRTIKFLLKRLGLWPAMVWLQTGGKMFKQSEGDGVYYSFSAFDCIPVLRKKFPAIHCMNTTKSAGFNLYSDASHVVIFASKENN